MTESGVEGRFPWSPTAPPKAGKLQDAHVLRGAVGEGAYGVCRGVLKERPTFQRRKKRRQERAKPVQTRTRPAAEARAATS